METAKTKQSTNDNQKEAGKMPDNYTVVIDMYNRQLSLITGFYINFLNTIAGSVKNPDQENSFTNIFDNNHNFTKIFFNDLNPAGNEFQNPFQASFEKIFNQLADYNRNLFSDFTGEPKNSALWNETSKRYKEIIDLRLEVSGKLLKAATEAYAKQLEYSFENNKKMLEGINTRFDSVIEQTQRFWADTLNVNNINKTRLTEEDLNINEPTPAEIARKSTTSTPPVMDPKA